MANGAYPQSEEGIKARKSLIEEVHAQVDEMVLSVLEPEEVVDYDELYRTNQFYAQGEAGLEKLRWDFRAGRVKLPD